MTQQIMKLMEYLKNKHDFSLKWKNIELLIKDSSYF